MAVVKPAQEPWKEGKPQSYSISEITEARKVGLRSDPTLRAQMTPIEGRTASRGIAYVNLGLIAKHGADQSDVIFGGHDDSWSVAAVNTSCLDSVDGMVGSGRAIIETNSQRPKVNTTYALDTDLKDPNAICVDVESEALLGKHGLGLALWTKSGNKPVQIDLTDPDLSALAIVNNSCLLPILYELKVPTDTGTIDISLEIIMTNQQLDIRIISAEAHFSIQVPKASMSVFNELTSDVFDSLCQGKVFNPYRPKVYKFNKDSSPSNLGISAVGSGSWYLS